MAAEILDNLLACTSCGAFFRWLDDRLTVKTHPIGGRAANPECPGGGTVGVDLGPREQYDFDVDGVLIYLGSHHDPRTGVICPNCHVQSSMRCPPDGAFHPRTRVLVRCPRCRWLILLQELRQGPQGVWQ
jgi:hypothetical protein